MKFNSLIWLVYLPCSLGLAPVTQAQRKPAPAPVKDPAPVYKAGIRVLARSYGDSVLLRWAPTAAWAWNSLNTTGYIVERVDITDPKKPKKQLLTVQPIRPLPLETFKQRFDRNNQYAAAAAQCLYGKNFSSNVRKSYGGIQDQSAVFTDRYAFGLMVADFDGRVAEAMGLRLTDKNVTRGALYVYRVYPAGKTSPARVDTGGALVENKGPFILSRPRLGDISSGDRVSELHWSRYQQENYSGYNIERSEDGRNFTPLTKTPFFASVPDSSVLKKDSNYRRLYELLRVNQVFIDSLPKNYVAYRYRIRGIDAFGQWSEYSDTLSALGRDLTPPQPAIMKSPKYAGGRSIRLQWEKKSREADFKGYIVSRSHNSVTGPFELITGKILDPGVTEFTDTAAFAHGQNYYLVGAVDTANNIAASAPAMGLVPDKTPPAPPTGLKGFIEKNGRVHLSWNPNTEEDLKGYKVYYANNGKHVYSQVTLSPYSDTSFVDSISLKNLTRNIWYKLVAVDQNNNHSEFSAALQLRKPDIVPPVPPLASKVFVDSSGIRIKWIRSPSTDVVRYSIFRKEGKKDWLLLQNLKADPSGRDLDLVDREIKPMVEYAYCAEAIDEDSLHSAKSTPLYASVKTLPERPALTSLTATYNDKQHQVKLAWTFKETGNYFFLIYKAAGSGPLARYRSAGSSDTEYYDPVPAGQQGVLRYALQVIFKDDRGRTRLSEPVTIDLSNKK